MVRPERVVFATFGTDTVEYRCKTFSRCGPCCFGMSREQVLLAFDFGFGLVAELSDFKVSSESTSDSLSSGFGMNSTALSDLFGWFPDVPDVCGTVSVSGLMTFSDRCFSTSKLASVIVGSPTGL